MCAKMYFPLRWESTGDQWWFASPIDWASANGHYDLVKHLLLIDSNLIFKLTSLLRIRRLEAVWDDDGAAFRKCRARVARNLLHECETARGYNSLIRAGYGGWLLYTAASAGDVVFVRELLDRDPLLVFGEGEYGVTDLFYAAARSKSAEVFRLLYDHSVADKGGRRSSLFHWEMMNRAVHAAARGGAVAVLDELLGDGSDVLGFRDAQGSTVLHTAAGRGQVPVVKKLLSSYNMIDAVDDRGNTALNVAAYRGQLPVFKVLVSASPSTATLTNNYGDTFLHMSVAGFRTPTFKRLDRHMELVKELLGGDFISIRDIINVQNNDGRTALHTAVIENIQSDVVELLLSVGCIDLNIRDCEGNTPLDLLYQLPRSPSSVILIKKMVLAGGISGFQDRTTTRDSLVSSLRMHGIGSSPGTSFRIPDAELVLHTGVEEMCRSSCELTSSEYGYSGEIRSTFATPETSSSKYKRSSSMSSASERLKILLRWRGKKGKIPELEDALSGESCSTRNSTISLREQFARQSSSMHPSNKRILLLQGNLPSPSSRNKFSQNARQVIPKSNLGSPLSACSESSWSSPVTIDKKNKIESASAGPSSSNQSPNIENMKMKMKRKHESFNLRLMNNYFCLGAQGLAVEDAIHSQGQQHGLVDVV